MQFFFIHPIHDNEPKEDHAIVLTHRPMDYSNEGSEFLDDAIRMDELPAGRTEESADSGEMETNESLGKVVTDLQQKGYCADLSFETDTFSLYGSDLDMRLNPEAFHVDEIDRIGNESQADHGAVVYAISTSTGVKGIIIDH